MVLCAFDILVYVFSIYQARILLFPADLFNRKISSARLGPDKKRNRAISKLSKISLIQSRTMSPQRMEIDQIEYNDMTGY